ncbi:hypothetical protein SEUCBS140593_004640 [Sporothrix eucalyptigena]|uniref:FMN hydroxy acid dehydrogenase domain-containing protein n=1 Tax=Sporothrix eucalyptigena TaxID=1812306 RepID=A0ABP0BPX0_9PEZI
MGLSTYATTTLEEVIQQPGSDKIPYGFQLSILQNRETSLQWIKRAEASGYKALFITVDAPVLGHRLNEKRNKLELPDSLCLPNLKGEEYVDSAGVKYTKPVRTFYNPGRDPSNTWESVIPWVRSHTKLDIWLKGIYTPEDVLLAIKYKVDGIIISNHGGRQLDGVPATVTLD